MTLKLTTPAFRHDPYPLYADLRTHSPLQAVTLGVLGDAMMVTRYADVMTVLKDPRFSNERYKSLGRRDWLSLAWVPGPLRVLTKSMVLMDDPDHARLRNLVHKGFTPRMIQQLEGRITAICSALLETVQAKPSVDLIADFARPLPLAVIMEMMGIPPANQPTFARLMTGFLEATDTSVFQLRRLPRLVRYGVALNRFFSSMITLKQTNPQDDLITALVQAEDAGDSLSKDELVAMLFLLLFAGHETTVNLIGNGMLALLEHPDQLARLRADMGLLDSAIEEMLRFTNPVQHVAQRYALEDVPLLGHTIPKGSTVAVGIAAANRDEAAFDKADQFDIGRTNNRHVAFGVGIHYCLGAPLARLEARIAFTALLTRFSQITLAVPSEMLRWRGAPSLRGLCDLPVVMHAE